MFANVDIFLPDIDTQQKTSSVLSNLDSKISLNRAINRNLEALAKQLYDYWFVQFDFPDENGKPYKSSGGKMVWNEVLKREVPEGWEVKDLSTYLSVYVEKISSKDIDSNMKYAPIEVLPRNKMSFCESVSIENAISGLCKFYRKNILLSNRRVYFHKVCIASYDGITRDTVIVLIPTQEENLGYVYQLVNDDVFIEYATRHSYGTEQPVLSWETAKSYKVIKPLNNLDLVYSNRINPIIDIILNNEAGITSLTHQRDELLPLLMNGQVTIE
jgi:type I restriction enzyme S subunit